VIIAGIVPTDVITTTFLSPLGISMPFSSNFFVPHFLFSGGLPDGRRVKVGGNNPVSQSVPSSSPNL
jgi:hypothetical protein